MELLGKYYPPLLLVREMGTTAERNRSHAAHVPYAELVHPFRCRNRWCHIWQLCHAQLHSLWFPHGTGAGYRDPPTLLPSNWRKQKWWKDFCRHKCPAWKAGMMMHSATIVYATIIVAPNFTKNKEGRCTLKWTRPKRETSGIMERKFILVLLREAVMSTPSQGQWLMSMTLMPI